MPTQDKVIVKNLLLRSIIGINPEERVKKQDILINLVMYTDMRAAAASDNITDAANYKAITERITQHVAEAADCLVEKLVTDIARIILSEFPIERAIVRVEKPEALRFTESVGVEIDRTRADFTA